MWAWYKINGDRCRGVWGNRYLVVDKGKYDEVVEVEDIGEGEIDKKRVKDSLRSIKEIRLITRSRVFETGPIEASRNACNCYTIDFINLNRMKMPRWIWGWNKLMKL